MKLNLNRQPQWLVLPYGVKVEVRPLTTVINSAAQAEAQKRTAALIVEAEAAEKTGHPMDPLGPNGANAAWLDGQFAQFYIAALARYAIKRWEGINGDDGQPLPVTPAATEAMAEHPDLGPAFRAAYGRSLAEQVAEGNASAASSAGASPEASEAALDAPAPPAGPASKGKAKSDAEAAQP